MILKIPTAHTVWRARKGENERFAAGLDTVTGSVCRVSEPDGMVAEHDTATEAVRSLAALLKKSPQSSAAIYKRNSTGLEDVLSLSRVAEN